jgi:hypothetical protein
MVTDFCDSDEEVVYMATIPAPAASSASSAQANSRRESLVESPAGPFSAGFDQAGDTVSAPEDAMDVAADSTAPTAAVGTAKFVPKLPPQSKIPRPESVNKGYLKLEPGTTRGPVEPKKKGINSFFQPSPVGQRSGASGPAGSKVKAVADNDDSEFEEDWDSGSDDADDEPQDKTADAEAPVTGKSCGFIPYTCLPHVSYTSHTLYFR